MEYRDKLILPYTNAVILEILRLGNIAPTALPHTVLKDLEIEGKVRSISLHCVGQMRLIRGQCSWVKLYVSELKSIVYISNQSYLELSFMVNISQFMCLDSIFLTVSMYLKDNIVNVAYQKSDESAPIVGHCRKKARISTLISKQDSDKISLISKFTSSYPREFGLILWRYIDSPITISHLLLMVQMN